MNKPDKPKPKKTEPKAEKPRAEKVTRESLAIMHLMRAQQEAGTTDVVKRVEQLAGLMFTNKEIVIRLDLTTQQAQDLERPGTTLSRAVARGRLDAQERSRRALVAAAETGDLKAMQELKELQYQLTVSAVRRRK